MLLVALFLNLFFISFTISSINVLFYNNKGHKIDFGTLQIWSTITCWTQLIAFIVSIVLLCIYWKDYYLWSKQCLERINRSRTG